MYCWLIYIYFSWAACNLINNEMKQFIISSETDVIREAEDRVKPTIDLSLSLSNLAEAAKALLSLSTIINS